MSGAPVITHVMDIGHFSVDDSFVISRNRGPTTKFNINARNVIFFIWSVLHLILQALSNISKACIISDEYFIYYHPRVGSLRELAVTSCLHVWLAKQCCASLQGPDRQRR